LGDEVPGEGGAGDAFAEDKAVVDRGDGDGGGTEVDYKGGGLAGCEAGVERGFSTREDGGEIRERRNGREGMVEDLRGADTVAGEPEGRTAPVFHGDFDGFFAVFASVPAGLGHEEGVFFQGLLVGFNAGHVVVHFSVFEIELHQGIAGARVRETGCNGVFPDIGGEVPVFHRSIFSHWVPDVDAGERVVY